jgi:hypothetical protein
MQRGITATLDEKEFAPGHLWKERFQALIDKKPVVVLCLLSPDFVRSPACRYELRTARALSLSKGIPIIPVLIRKCRRMPTPLRGVLYQDMRRAFELFEAGNKGGSDREAKASIRRLVIAVRQSMARLHIHRVLGADDPALGASADVYNSYPEAWRDDLDGVKEWLAECSPDNEDQYWDEHYYVAYYRGEVVGVLHATHYPTVAQSRVGYCAVNCIVVKEGSEVCGRNNVAYELLTRMKADVQSTDGACSRFLAELPARAGVSREERNRCLVVWRYLGGRREVKLQLFHGCNYRRARADRSGRHGSWGANLLAVFGYPKREMSKKEFEKEVLDFMYGVLHAEEYVDPFLLRGWVAHLNRIQAKVRQDLPDRIVLRSASL